ncbi:MAG: hypothetical protein HFH59_06635 [Lachnospiraceae bacterium]|nr:hypothetical protein [Lachnospiraceae bacterium]
MEVRDISQRRWMEMNKRIATLEGYVQGQQLLIELLFEFCKAVAAKEGLSLLSYQQLNSPSADGCRKVRMLFQKIREF